MGNKPDIENSVLGGGGVSEDQMGNGRTAEKKQKAKCRIRQAVHAAGPLSVLPPSLMLPPPALF